MGVVSTPLYAPIHRVTSPDSVPPFRDPPLSWVGLCVQVLFVWPGMGTQSALQKPIQGFTSQFSDQSSGGVIQGRLFVRRGPIDLQGKWEQARQWDHRWREGCREGGGLPCE